jgi:hypothetical protein
MKGAFSGRVSTEQRAACFERINVLIHSRGFQAIVYASRDQNESL